MDAKSAIKTAKAYVQDIFSDEGVLNIGLEEISYDDKTLTWDVTVGFSRRWDSQNAPFAAALQAPSYRRTYKIVEVSDATGEVLSVRNRASEFAA
ncbi:MAG: hypothetical protein Q7J28_10600 [Caulobacter sp.]|nr:hypothetical protein [Caulobacter sp.]